MLVDEPRVKIESNDVILKIIAEMNGHITETIHHATGVYEVGHFGSSSFLREGYKEAFDLLLPISEYGVCDNYQQILDQCPEIQDPNRKFVIVLTKIEKATQPESGGWRWHKWGPYIGTRQPTTEYLRDEPEIDQVYVYHIHEKE